ncbi:MAG: hypothetical protein ACTS73_05425 [Arsenophonus sp. NEOnobi-MAG3]
MLWSSDLIGDRKDGLQSHYFNSAEEFEITLHKYVCLYNQELSTNN